MANTLLTGSINLSDIPKAMIKKVVCKDGKTRYYLNIAIIERKEPQTFTNNGVARTYTHFVSCAPQKKERKEGVNYIIGDIETRTFNGASVAPTIDDVNNAPAVTPGESMDLPF